MLPYTQSHPIDIVLHLVIIITILFEELLREPTIRPNLSSNPVNNIHPQPSYTTCPFAPLISGGNTISSEALLSLERLLGTSTSPSLESPFSSSSSSCIPSTYLFPIPLHPQQLPSLLRSISSFIRLIPVHRLPILIITNASKLTTNLSVNKHLLADHPDSPVPHEQRPPSPRSPR